MEGYRPWLAAFVAASAGESKTSGALAEALGGESNGAKPAGVVPFNSERRWSALKLELAGQSRVFVLGAPETVLPLADSDAGLRAAYDVAAEQGRAAWCPREAARFPTLRRDGLRPRRCSR
jgi:magnesium-transporting ATPase (P-type)